MPRPQSADAERLAPQIGTFGIDEGGMNRTVATGDDFYEYANGTWAKTTTIPADKSNYGMFTVHEDLSKKRTQALLEDAEQAPNRNDRTSVVEERRVQVRVAHGSRRIKKKKKKQ